MTSKPLFLGEQFSIDYLIHVFDDDVHRRAWQSVHRDTTLVRLSNCHGSKRTYTADHRYEDDPRVDSLRATLQDGELPAQPTNARGETPTGEVAAPSIAVRVVSGRAEKPYTLNGVTKWIFVGQTINVLHSVVNVPAEVIKLGDHYIEVSFVNGPYRGRTLRKIDMTTTGPGLNFDKVIISA